MTDTKVRDEIALLAKSLFDRGYVVGTAGNISVRVEDGFLVTPTNSSFGFLDPARISKLDPQGRHIAGDPPSKEGSLHLAFYETRADARAVVHLHSTYATAISCLPDIDPEDAIPPITPYMVMRVGRVKLLPYVRPGDPKMGDLVRALGGKYPAVLLANHGPALAAKDLRSAVFVSEELEESARIVLLLHGLNPRHLTPDQIADLVKIFQARR
jgi:ribulose-5-phosphate 4-epimerase/fuculose-1-phosphate aldolase